MADQHLDLSSLSGLPAAGSPAVFPGNTHLCHFYRNRRELLEIVVPFFCEGLARKEACLWGVGAPLTVKEAADELGRAVPALGSYAASGQLLIFDVGALYGAGPFKARAVLDAFWEAVAQKRTEGWTGLRCDGITSGVLARDWKNFQTYEEEISLNFPASMIALCSYNAADLSPAELQDAAESHLALLVKRESGWTIVDTPGAALDQEAA